MIPEIPVLRVVDSRVGIRNAFTRMPFRFGVVTMEAAPVGLLRVELETADGRRATGWASDFLAYKWFDKRPERTPADNVQDLLSALRHARAVYAAAGPSTPFALWRDTRGEIEARALADGFNRLGASFAASMMERAVIDAVGRLAGLGFDAMVRTGVLGIDASTVFPELAADAHLAALPARPLSSIAVRHTVGLVDPITAEEARAPGLPRDGFPVGLDDYLRVDGLSYLKVKVSGDRDADIARLTAIAEVMAAQGREIRVTLDGNEQYKALDAFVGLMERIRTTPALAAFYDSILFVEQPLDRSVAMAGPLPADALDAIGRPLLIDEADGWAEAFRDALALGYRGVSHKNCKGVYRSLLNAALARRETEAGRPCFLSAEDLTTLPVVPLQADLAVVATLGIGHVERNGHHYFRGLDHLPAAERERALAAHPDLYERHGDTVALRIRDGRLSIGSLRAPGLGVALVPEIDDTVPEHEWTFDLLEIAR